MLLRISKSLLELVTIQRNAAFQLTANPLPLSFQLNCVLTDECRNFWMRFTGLKLSQLLLKHAGSCLSLDVLLQVVPFREEIKKTTVWLCFCLPVRPCFWLGKCQKRVIIFFFMRFKWWLESKENGTSSTNNRNKNHSFSSLLFFSVTLKHKNVPDCKTTSLRKAHPQQTFLVLFFK